MFFLCEKEKKRASKIVIDGKNFFYLTQLLKELGKRIFRQAKRERKRTAKGLKRETEREREREKGKKRMKGSEETAKRQEEDMSTHWLSTIGG